MKALILTLMLAASGPWSLQDCIQYALDNNIQVRQSELAVQQREIELNTARNARLPGVSASGSQNFSFGRGLTADNTYANTNTTNTSFSLGADLPIFQGFQINNQIALGQLNLEAATADLEKARDDIRVAVAKGYVQILYNQEILAVAQNQVEVDAAQLDRLEQLMANGKASTAEVAAQRATLAQSRLSETQAQGNLSLSLLDLSQLLELPSPDGFSVLAPDIQALGIGALMNPEDIYAEAVGVKPTILAEEIRLGNAERNIALAKGGYYPSLSLSGGLGTNYYTSSGREAAAFGEQLKNNFSQYIGLSLRIPIFSRFSTRNQVRSAQLNYHNQLLSLENAKKTLYKEIQTAYYNAVNSQSKYASSEEAALSAQQAFDLTREKYENGKANITEYNESKNRYLRAESDFLQARYEYLYQSRLLDFYRGAEITF
ncbi:MAG: TolC family protein [Bacteroidales bacterium]|nr:TolC family protein [Bacteroidales bacterium]MCR5276394.1 TolC family protein [Bacteroidales bacterium]